MFVVGTLQKEMITWDPPKGKFGKSSTQKCWLVGDMLVPRSVNLGWPHTLEQLAKHISYIPCLGLFPAMLPTPMRCFLIIWRNFLPNSGDGWVFGTVAPFGSTLDLDHSKAQGENYMYRYVILRPWFSQRRCWFKNDNNYHPTSSNGHVSCTVFVICFAVETMLNLWHQGFHHESWTIYIHPILVCF